MVKMRDNTDGREFDASDEEAYQLQAQGKAHRVDDAERAAKAYGEGNYSSATGRPDQAVADKPESLSAPGTPDQDNDEPAGDDEKAAQPVRTPQQAQNQPKKR